MRHDFVRLHRRGRWLRFFIVFRRVYRSHVTRFILAFLFFRRQGDVAAIKPAKRYRNLYMDIVAFGNVIIRDNTFVERFF